MLRWNFANLKIGARRDVAKRSAQPLGKISQPGELPVLEDAVRNPQPAHVGILRRRHIEQAVIAPTKIIRRRRRGVVDGLLLQPWIGIEWMLFAFVFLWIGELLARCNDLVLRLDMRGIRSNRFRVCFAGATKAAPDPADLQTGGKAFEVAF